MVLGDWHNGSQHIRCVGGCRFVDGGVLHPCANSGAGVARLRSSRAPMDTREFVYLHAPYGMLQLSLLGARRDRSWLGSRKNRQTPRGDLGAGGTYCDVSDRAAFGLLLDPLSLVVQPRCRDSG